MSARPDLLPVCRLQHALPIDHVTAWRRAHAGKYGAVVRDAEGRQSVTRDAVERAEGIALSDAQLEAIFAKSSQQSRAIEKVRRERARTRELPREPVAMPGLPTINVPTGRWLSREYVHDLIALQIAARDLEWIDYVNARLSRAQS